MSVDNRIVGRVTFETTSRAVRQDHVLCLDRFTAETDSKGYAGILCNTAGEAHAVPRDTPVVANVATHHLADGDVVALDPSGHVRTLYRKASRNNFLFATDRCNSYCVMCSQPPKPVVDDWRVREMLRTVELLDPETRELIVTGGEPTLLKDDLVDLLRRCRDRLPKTAIHVLSNGRLFAYRELARRVGAVRHPDLMFGVPVYSDLDWRHDHVVQAKGAFDETLVGLHNLAAASVPIEIRVVLHRLTLDRLVSLSEFIYRNLTFASHVTFMGLEATGFAVPNFRSLWVDPWDYREILEEATLFLANRGMNVSIYNHQLCTVPESLWAFCRQSISDWKNEYLPICDVCAVKPRCGGFFASSVERTHSGHIRPIA